MLRLASTTVLVTCVAFTAGCTLGRDYSRPAVELPEAHRFDQGPAGPGSLADLEWFALFGDDALSGLVSAALTHNFDVRIAAERVLQARALYGIARADRLPAAGVSAEATARRSSDRGVAAGADTTLSYTQAGFNVGWELDVWGRVRRLNEAARAQYLATEEARRGVVTTLVADVSEIYLVLRALDLELEIARRTRDIATEGLRLTEARRTSGLASGLDVRQAEQLLFTARGQIASIEREIALTEHALSLLVGRAPGAVPRGRALEQFQAPPEVPAGLPSTLLERRPDIRQAEQELVAANARIGSARAEYFPRISLTGFFGVQSRALADLLSGPAVLASASAGMAAPLFDGGRRQAGVALAEAVHREALVNYDRVVFGALREVADGLAGYARTREQRAEQQRLVAALAESTRLAAERYRGGLDSYLPVLDAQRNLFQGELDLARLHQQELGWVVRLYRALGGGWSPGAVGALPAVADDDGSSGLGVPGAATFDRTWTGPRGLRQRRRRTRWQSE